MTTDFNTEYEEGDVGTEDQAVVESLQYMVEELDPSTSSLTAMVEELSTSASFSAPGGHPVVDMKIKFLPHRDGLPMPEYKSIFASGIDLSAAITEDVPLNNPGATALIPTGVCVEVPAGYEVQVRPRSGLASKHGITVTNTPGTVDADYRGEILVSLVNLTGRRFIVERGMRIAQMVVCPVVQANLIVVDELSDTDRGTGGFGSTGLK